MRHEGVVVSIPSAESFSMTFYNIGRHYICDNFTKTQAFTMDEVEPNTRFHKWICRLLKSLEKDGRWWRFYVFDESEYYDTLDETRISKSFEEASNFIYTLARAVDKFAESIGGEVVVGGKMNMRELRKRYEEVYGDYRDYGEDVKKPKLRQTSLDEFSNRRIEDEEGF